MKLAVIGAGWAGLASAHVLQRAGVDVTVFEAAPIPGGRARRVESPNFASLDNGQHLMLGAYTACLTLIASLQAEIPMDQLIDRHRLHLEHADGHFRMHAPNLPFGLHGALALWCAKGLSIRDKWAATALMMGLRRAKWIVDQDQTVETLLKRYRQPESVIQLLWSPLCLAAMNTSIAQASAQWFVNTLRDGLAGHRRDSDFIIPKVDLSTLWPLAATQHLDMRYRHIVRDIDVLASHVEVDQEKFDGCIVAIPPYAVARTLKCHTDHAAWLSLQQQLQAFQYNAIATLTLKLAQAWRLPQPLMLLNENPSLGFYGQWVFNRPLQPDQLTVVISDSGDHLKADQSVFTQKVAEQIRSQVARHKAADTPMPEVVAHKLIIEKRATFVAEPHLARPKVRTAWPRLFLAGDYTDTGYPAVLEGAVRSGITAANTALSVMASMPKS